MTKSPSTKQQRLLGNLIAGATTAIVIIPQGMAYALVAGLPPIHGLYASMLPLIGYALLGKSRQMAVGPGALDTLLIGTGLGGLAFVNESNYAIYAALIALEVALIQITLGLFRAGFAVNFLSRPVISGFTSAAGLTIGFSQMRNLFGYTAPKTHHFHEMVSQLATHLPDANPYTAALGIGAAGLLIGLKRLNKRFPRALFVTLLGIGVVELFGLEAKGVAILGEIPAGLPALSVPKIELSTLTALLPTSITIAFVGYLTMISIARTFADRNKYDINPSRELVAAGVANLLASVSQGFPVSASFSRSAVHASAGATSPLALLSVAGWVALTLLFLTDYLYSLPKAVLAAIIITAVFGLIDAAIVRRLYKVKRVDMWLLLITFVATLTVGIEPGIFIGVGTSLLFFLVRTTRPHAAVLGRIKGTRDYRKITNYPDVETFDRLLILRIDAQFYFGNVTFLKDLLRRLEREQPFDELIIEACSLNQLDSSADMALHDIYDDFRARGITLTIASTKVPVQQVMKASGLWQKMGEDRFFMNVEDAVQDFLARRPQ